MKVIALLLCLGASGDFANFKQWLATIAGKIKGGLHTGLNQNTSEAITVDPINLIIEMHWQDTSEFEKHWIRLNANNFRARFVHIEETDQASNPLLSGTYLNSKLIKIGQFEDQGAPGFDPGLDYAFGGPSGWYRFTPNNWNQWAPQVSVPKGTGDGVEHEYTASTLDNVFTTEVDTSSFNEAEHASNEVKLSFNVSVPWRPNCTNNCKAVFVVHHISRFPCFDVDQGDFVSCNGTDPRGKLAVGLFAWQQTVWADGLQCAVLATRVRVATADEAADDLDTDDIDPSAVRWIVYHTINCTTKPKLIYWDPTGSIDSESTTSGASTVTFSLVGLLALALALL